MATYDEATAAIAETKTNVDTLKKAVEDMIARVETLIAAGGTITPTMLQGIVDAAKATTTEASVVTGEAAAERP